MLSQIFQKSKEFFKKVLGKKFSGEKISGPGEKAFWEADANNFIRAMYDSILEMNKEYNNLCVEFLYNRLSVYLMDPDIIPVDRRWYWNRIPHTILLISISATFKYNGNILISTYHNVKFGKNGMNQVDYDTGIMEVYDIDYRMCDSIVEKYLRNYEYDFNRKKIGYKKELIREKIKGICKEEV